jgi:hypothetical protein
MTCPYCQHPKGPGRVDVEIGKVKWCCSRTELNAIKDVLDEIALQFDDHFMVTSREILNAALTKQGVCLPCTDR